MAGNNNRNVFFRLPGLDPERDQQEYLPFDIAEWFDKYRTTGRGAGAPGAVIDGIFVGDPEATNQFPPGFKGEGAQEQLPIYMQPGPGLTAKQPQVIDIVSQKVVQDAQGNATVTVTFSIGPEQDNMKYELRLSKP